MRQPALGQSMMTNNKASVHLKRLMPMLVVSLAVGFVITGLSGIPFAFRQSAAIYGRFNIVFVIMSTFFMPGLFLSALLGGNLHNCSLVLGAIMNWLIYTLCTFCLLKRVCKGRGAG
jgi:uncharacterized membrane protein